MRYDPAFLIGSRAELKSPAANNARIASRTATWLVVLLAAVPVHAAGDRIDVYPPNVHLSNSLDRQPFVVVATRNDGVTEDVTGRAKAVLKDMKLARLEKNTLYPLADGNTELNVEHNGGSVSIPVIVAGASAARPVSFKLDVMPVFMRTGCNTGACHGSARVQDGFRLSLFG